MKKTKKNFKNGGHTLCALMLTLGLVGCDDGNLNTVLEAQSLAIYMEEHPNLRLYLHGISNYREPIFICAYGSEPGEEQGPLLTPAPVGKYGSTGGIPYGELTAVEIPVDDPTMGVDGIFMMDGLAPCPLTVQDAMSAPGYLTNSYGASGGDDGGAGIAIATGYLASTRGGEDWMVCGDSGTESCESMAGIGIGGTSLLPNTPQDPEKTTLSNFALVSSFDTVLLTRTLCWTAGDGETATVGLSPAPYEPPYGWWEVAPLLSGVVHLHDGEVDCDTAAVGDAVAKITLPADPSFGPDGYTISYGPGSSGTFLLMGNAAPGIPSEAGLRIIPILHWTE